MKTTLLSLLITILTFYNTALGQIQEWQDVSPFPGAGRDGSVSFTIGETAYVGLGVIYDTYSTYQDDFYKYDVQNDEWTPIADFPGAARASAVAFVSNNKAYVGTGYDSDNSFADFYEYDPATNSWRPIASIPEARRSASSFTIDNTGYVGLGSGSSSQLSDFYKYDVALDQWTPITGVGAGKERVGAIGFAANGKGYISSGQRFDGGTFVYQDILSYDPNSDTWVEELDYNINLSSLMSNTAYVDEDGLVHVLKSSSSNSEVIINLSDFSVRSDDYYFTDDRDDPIVFYINNEVIAGLGATGNIFDPVYQTSFQKLVTIIIEPPIAPTVTRTYDWWDGIKESTIVYWENNEPDDFDSNIIYLSNGDNSSYRTVGTVGSNSTNFTINSYLLDPNTIHYVKIAANRKGVKSVSEELSFYPVFREGKINAPTILSIKTGDILSDLEMEIVNNDLSEGVILERSLDDNPFEVIDSLGTLYSQDTSTISFYDNYDFTPTKIKYRIRLYDQDSIRQTSDYSNEIELDVSSLQPAIKGFKFAYFEDRSYYTWLSFNYDEIVNYRYAVLEYKHITDSVFTNSDTVGYRNPGFNSFYEYDSIEARLIVSNQFGADTSDIVTAVTPLFSPRNVELEYSSISTIGIYFVNNSNKNVGVVVERSENGNEFAPYDTLKASTVRYYDQNITTGNSYSYRLYNFSDYSVSSTSRSVSSRAANMGVWKKFRGDGLASVIDSIGSITVNHKIIEEDNIYFLSVSSRQLYKYNLTDTTLLKLQDLPDDSLMNFTAVIYYNNVIYGLGAKDYNYQVLPTIYRYNIEKDSWDKSLEIPYGDSQVNISHVVNDKIYMVMQNRFGSLEIAYYDTSSGNWVKNEYQERYVYPTYIEHDSDSLIIFAENKGKISYDFATREISVGEEVMSSDSLFYNSGVVQYNDELLHLSNKSINVLTTENEPFLTYKEYLPVHQDLRGYAFTYENKLLYGLSYGNINYNNELQTWYYRTDLLYYKDENAPLRAAEIKVDSVGISGAKISWIDSPNEDSYQIEIFRYDSVYVNDTLQMDTKEYTTTGLQQNSNFTVRLTSLKEGNAGSSVEGYFRTKRGIPFSPTNFTSKAISSSEILYTWDPVDTTDIPVDTLIITNYDEVEINLNLTDTSYLHRGLEENQSYYMDLIVKNEYGSSRTWVNNNAITYLNTPFISSIEVHETAKYYDVVFEDKSSEENYYIVYRKSASDTAYVKLDSISTSAYTISEENLHFEDKKADISMNYEYYLVAEYKGVNEFSDTTIYYSRVSLPSDAASTENAVLSVNPYLDKYISIYPNPSDQEVFIKVERDVRIERIEVLNVNGGIMKVFERNLVYNISDLKDGLYFVKIYTNQGATTKKIVKQ